jgi:hypothetical protein
MYHSPHPAQNSQAELELTEKENLELEILEQLKTAEKKNPYQGNSTTMQTK